LKGKDTSRVLRLAPWGGDRGGEKEVGMRGRREGRKGGKRKEGRRERSRKKRRIISGAGVLKQKSWS